MTPCSVCHDLDGPLELCPEHEAELRQVETDPLAALIEKAATERNLESAGAAEAHWRRRAIAVAEAAAPILAVAQEFASSTSDDERLYLLPDDLGTELANGDLKSDFTFGQLRAAAAALDRLREVSA